MKSSLSQERFLVRTDQISEPRSCSQLDWASDQAEYREVLNVPPAAGRQSPSTPTTLMNSISPTRQIPQILLPESMRLMSS